MRDLLDDVNLLESFQIHLRCSWMWEEEEADVTGDGGEMHDCLSTKTQERSFGQFKPSRQGLRVNGVDGIAWSC